MRFRSSIASTLARLLLLSVSVPLRAAPRDSDSPRWQRPIDRVVRAIQGVAKFFGISSDGDSMIPPTPKP